MKSNCQKVKIAPGNSNFSYHHPRPTAQFKLGKVMLHTSFFFSVPAIILNTGITYFSITIIKIVIKIIVIKHLLKISPTTKCANSADYYFPYIFSFCPKNSSERLYVDPPTMLSSRF